MYLSWSSELLNLSYSQIPYHICFAATLTFNRTKTIQSSENNLFMNIVGMALVILNLNILMQTNPREEGYK